MGGIEIWKIGVYGHMVGRLEGREVGREGGG